MTRSCGTQSNTVQQSAPPDRSAARRRFGRCRSVLRCSQRRWSPSIQQRRCECRSRRFAGRRRHPAPQAESQPRSPTAVSWPCRGYQPTLRPRSYSALQPGGGLVAAGAVLAAMDGARLYLSATWRRAWQRQARADCRDSWLHRHQMAPKLAIRGRLTRQHTQAPSWCQQSSRQRIPLKDVIA